MLKRPDGHFSHSAMHNDRDAAHSWKTLQLIVGGGETALWMQNKNYSEICVETYSCSFVSEMLNFV